MAYNWKEDKNIPSMEYEYAVSKEFYGRIFALLPENATLKDAEPVMNEGGNVPWFKKFMNYFSQRGLISKFKTAMEGGPSFGIEHTAAHLITAAAHTNKGEVQSLTTEMMLNSRKITLQNVINSFNDSRLATPGYLNDAYKFTTVVEMPYRENAKINSKENVHIARVAFNSIFAIESLRKDLGGTPFCKISFGKNRDNLPAEFFKPNEIMHITDLNFLEFDKNGIKPKDGLEMPDKTITLISRSCEQVNKLAKGESLIM